MNQIQDILDNLIKHKYITDYDIFKYSSEIEIMILTNKTSEYEKIIEYISDMTSKTIDYEIDENNKWQTLYLVGM